MSNLLLHVDAGRVTRRDLENVELPEPTPTWHPVAHTRVLDTVTDRLADMNIPVRREQLGLTHDGARFFGTLDLDLDVYGGDVSLSVGIRNSIDKSISAGLAVGERVFVCDNLCFSGEIVAMRKHTRHILRDLDGKVTEALVQLDKFRELAGQRIERLHNLTLTDSQAHDLMVRAADRGCIAWSGIGRVLAEYREPQHDVFLPRNAWSLMNAFTEVAKVGFQKNPVRASVQTIQLTSLFTSACERN